MKKEIDKMKIWKSKVPSTGFQYVSDVAIHERYIAASKPSFQFDPAHFGSRWKPVPFQKNSYLSFHLLRIMKKTTRRSKQSSPIDSSPSDANEKQHYEERIRELERENKAYQVSVYNFIMHCLFQIWIVFLDFHF